MRKLLMLLLFLMPLVASGQCSSPVGPIAEFPSPPLCYDIGSCDTVDVCFEFTAPGSILFFASLPAGSCSTLTATATLYDTLCAVVQGNALGLVFTVAGEPYIWCLHYVCNGTHDTIYCPTYQDFSALPVEWLYFKGYAISESVSAPNPKGSEEGVGVVVKLMWATASESNCNYFDIEHSVTGVSWAPVERVLGSGYSNVIQEYESIIYNPDTGLNFYRIRQVDFDGEYHYSGVVGVRVERGSGIRVQGSNVTDVWGRGVRRLDFAPSGIYFIRDNGRVRKVIRFKP